jgi:hypothetical protein
MTQTADKESEELKVTMNAIAKATEANAKAIADLTRRERDVGKPRVFRPRRNDDTSEFMR